MRIGWLDTLRVMASFLVILSHYAYVVGNVSSVQNFFHTYIFHIGQIGVILFLAVSGYLAANSIEHSKNILEYYRRKVIRITVPFTVAYIVLGLLLVFLGMFEPKLMDQSPFKNIINVGGHITGILTGMLPISMDINLMQMLHLPVYALVGEWFIGTIIYLYFVSPLLYKLIRWNVIVTFVVSMVIAVYSLDIATTWKAAGIFRENVVFFPIRIPEFLVGMIFYTHGDLIARHFKKLTWIFVVLGLSLGFYALSSNTSAQSIVAKIVFGNPLNLWQYFYATIVIGYFAYRFSVYFNEHFEKFAVPFNKLSNISYMAMLIHHAVIYRIAASYNFSTLSKFGVFFFFVMILVMTMALSEYLRTIYKPLEEKLVKWRR